MNTAAVTIAELAGRLGHAADWFYRPGNLDALYAEGMPRPMSEHGHKRWERSGVEAWLTRHHPAALPAPANDAGPLPDPRTDAAWRERLARAYS